MVHIMKKENTFSGNEYKVKQHLIF